MAPKLVLLFLFISFLIKTCVLTAELDRAVYHGIKARLGQFPYAVGLLTRSTDPLVRKKGFCTGAIIAKDWVVTASHCYRSIPSIWNVNMTYFTTEVTAGSLDVFNPSDTEQKRTVIGFAMIKPEYENKRDNDVLIMKMDYPFMFNDYVGAITIAKPPLPKGKTIKCVLLGFGTTEIHPNLRDVAELFYTYGTIDAVRYHPCINKTTNPGYDDNHNPPGWNEKHVCVTPVDYRSAICYGDSGGPIVCDGLDVGISALMINIENKGIKCGTKGVIYIHHFFGNDEDWLRKYIPELPPFETVKVEPQRSESEAEHKRSARGGANRGHVCGTWLLLVEFILGWYIRSSIFQSSPQILF